MADQQTSPLAWSAFAGLAWLGFGFMAAWETDAPSSTCRRSECESVFDRVIVSYLRRGGTRVMWELVETFDDPPPYEFQLQVGQSRNPDAPDWEDVGGPVTDILFSIDGEQRTWGKLNYTFYRVKLTTSLNVYYSEPTGATGTLNPRDWRLAREIIRQERLRMHQHAGQEGYLLKRRITGESCPDCTDPLTREIRDPGCTTCYGTGFRCGYFFPIDCVWADIAPETYHIERKAPRSTINDIVVRARMLNTWLLGEGDVWVNRVTDDRYYVHAVQNTAEMRGVSLIANVEMRPAPVTDVAYDIDIPQQVEALI